MSCRHNIDIISPIAVANVSQYLLFFFGVHQKMILGFITASDKIRHLVMPSIVNIKTLIIAALNSTIKIFTECCVHDNMAYSYIVTFMITYGNISVLILLVVDVVGQ